MKTCASKILVAGLLPLLLSGCVENAILVKANKDGSGTLVYRLLMDDQLSGGMQQVVETAASLSGELSAPDTTDMPTNFVQLILESLPATLGEDIAYESGREVDNEKGWKGFEAVYSFPDITRLDLSRLGDPSRLEDPAGDNGDGHGWSYRFEFEPGDVATLRLVPLAPPAPAVDAAVEPTEAASTNAPPAAGPLAALKNSPLGPLGEGALQKLGAGMQAAMTAMFEKLCAGLRVSMVVSVDGEVVESNAQFPSGAHSNAFVIVDVPFDEILAAPEARELLTQPAPDVAALAAMDVPGLRLEEPGKTIEIRFR